MQYVVPEKSLTWSERWKKGKRRQNKFQSALLFYFTQNTSTLSRCIQNLKTLALIGAEKSAPKNFIGEKEKKRTNKGNDKRKDADSLLHDTTTHIKCLYKISKS